MERLFFGPIFDRCPLVTPTLIYFSYFVSSCRYVDRNVRLDEHKYVDRLEFYQILVTLWTKSIDD